MLEEYALLTPKVGDCRSRQSSLFRIEDYKVGDVLAIREPSGEGKCRDPEFVRPYMVTSASQHWFGDVGVNQQRTTVPRLRNFECKAPFRGNGCTNNRSAADTGPKIQPLQSRHPSEVPCHFPFSRSEFGSKSHLTSDNGLDRL